MMLVNFTTEMRQDSKTLAELHLKIVQRYQFMRGQSQMSGTEIVAVEMAALMYSAAVLVRQLTPREQKSWREFMIEHFDKAIDS
jgi:hypothetical protein